MSKSTLVQSLRRQNDVPSADKPSEPPRAKTAEVDVAADHDAINENAETVRHAEQAETEVAAPGPWYMRFLEKLSRNLGHQHLIKLAQHRGKVAKSLDDVPKRMHRVANQTRLVLELIDDFIDGRYRKVSWRAMAVLAGAVLYTVSPGDVIPDVMPFLGAMDDLAVLAVATRLLRKDLEKYCRFKGYSVAAYFG